MLVPFSSQAAYAHVLGVFVPVGGIWRLVERAVKKSWDLKMLSRCACICPFVHLFILPMEALL